MRIVKAKVLATGKEVILAEKENEPGVFSSAYDNKEFMIDELEMLEDLDEAECRPSLLTQTQKNEPLDSIAMMKDMLDSMKTHFWRDQRVEIAKILLRREDLKVTEVAMMADEIVRKLKSYGE